MRESMAVVGFAGYLFWLDWRLAIVCLCTAPLVVYPLVRLGQRVRRTTRRSQEDLEHLTHLSAEAFAGHRIVKAFGAEAREAQRFGLASLSVYRTNMRITSALSALPPIMEFIGGLAAVGALWYGSRRIAEGNLTPGAFSSFLAAAFMMYGPIKKLSRVNAGLQQAIAAADRIFAMLDTHSEVRERPDAVALPRLRESVEFRDVGFAYEDRPDRFVLRHVGFTVRAGQVVALVGLSGAGKTTLVNLIPRFFDATEGAVLVDGVDVRDGTLASLRDQVALVTQDTVLFDDTVAANIAYGAPRASRGGDRAGGAGGARARVHRAAGGRVRRPNRRARAAAVRRPAPAAGHRAAPSSRTARCSCWTRRRRRSTPSPSVLVRDALANLMRNRTTFVIAHRLSTVRRADFIVALERGAVVEIGTHDELVARPGGVYARLYALQAFEPDRESEPAALSPGRPA